MFGFVTRLLTFGLLKRLLRPLVKQLLDEVDKKLEEEKREAKATESEWDDRGWDMACKLWDTVSKQVLSYFDA